MGTTNLQRGHRRNSGLNQSNFPVLGKGRGATALYDPRLGALLDPPLPLVCTYLMTLEYACMVV